MSTTTTSVKVTTNEPHITQVLAPTTSSIFSSSHLATLTTEPMEETFTTACTSLVPAWGRASIPQRTSVVALVQDQKTVHIKILNSQLFPHLTDGERGYAAQHVLMQDTGGPLQAGPHHLHQAL